MICSAGVNPDRGNAIGILFDHKRRFLPPILVATALGANAEIGSAQNGYYEPLTTARMGISNPDSAVA